MFVSPAYGKSVPIPNFVPPAEAALKNPMLRFSEFQSNDCSILALASTDRCNHQLPDKWLKNNSAPCFTIFSHYTSQLLNLQLSCQFSLVSSVRQEMSSSLWAMGWRPSVADWGSGMSASCKPRVQLFADAGNVWPHSALRYH